MSIVKFPDYIKLAVEFDDDGRCLTCGAIAEPNPPMGFWCETCPPRSLKDRVVETANYEPNRMTTMFAQFTTAVHSAMIDGHFAGHHSGWDDGTMTTDTIRANLKTSVENNDPIATAVYAAFLHNRLGDDAV